MLTISLEPADNGVIKIVYDDSVNGAGEEFVARNVYDFEHGDVRDSQLRFLEDLILDLGLDVGTELDPDQLKVVSEWGDKYEPDQSEIEERLAELKEEMAYLQAQLKKK